MRKPRQMRVTSGENGAYASEKASDHFSVKSSVGIAQAEAMSLGTDRSGSTRSNVHDVLLLSAVL